MPEQIETGPLTKLPDLTIRDYTGLDFKTIKAAINAIIEPKITCAKCKTTFVLRQADIDKKTVKCPFCFTIIKLEGYDE